MDKVLIAQKFSKSINSYNEEAKAQKLIANRLMTLLTQKSRKSFKNILEFGTGTGFLTQNIKDKIVFDQLYLNDLSSVFETLTLDLFNSDLNSKIEFLKGDIETITIPQKLDLVIGASTEQWIENKDQFYQKIYNALNHDGYFAFSTFGKNNLKELRQATGKGLTYYSLDELKKILTIHFNIIHCEEDEIVLNFSSALDILNHIKKTGVNAISKEDWTKKKVLQLLSKMNQIAILNHHFELTYHPIYFILQKK